MAKLSNTSPTLSLSVHDAKLGWCIWGKKYRSLPAARKKAEALAGQPGTLMVTINTRELGVNKTLERFPGAAK